MTSDDRKPAVVLGQRFGGPGRGFGHRYADLDQIVTAIILTKQALYVPSGVSVRERVTDFMLTGEFPVRLLESIEADAQVSRVEVARPVSPS